MNKNAHHRIATSVGDLHVTVTGNGPHVIFWPSLFIDGEMWAEQVASLASSYQCIVIDAPGQGQSQPLDAPITLDACGDALVAVMRHLDLDAAHIVGCSWGGMIAINVAARFPERVRSAVVTNSSVRPPALDDRVQVALLAPILKAFGFIAPIRSTIINGFFSKGAPSRRPELAANITAALERQSPKSVVFAAKSILGQRAGQAHLLTAIACPVLVIGGEEDSIFPPPHSQQIADGIAGAALHLLKDVGHLAPIEAGDRVARLVQSFLDKHNVEGAKL